MTRERVVDEADVRFSWDPDIDGIPEPEPSSLFEHIPSPAEQFEEQIQQMNQRLQAQEPEPRQLSMDRLLRQVPSVPTEKKDRKENQGYIRMSPSDFELEAKVAAIPDFDFSDIGELVTPTSNEVIGSLRGIEGHFSNQLFTSAVRYHLSHKNRSTLQSPAPSELLVEHQSLKPHEREQINQIVSVIGADYKTLRLIDIPDFVNDVRLQWRNQLTFVATERRQKDSPNAIKRKSGEKKMYKTIEGWAFGAADVHDLWVSEEQARFNEHLTQWQRSLVTDVVNPNLKNPYGIELPVEANPGTKLLIEQEMGYCVAFEMEGIKVQFFMRKDYFMWKRDLEKNLVLVVIDDKFGPLREETEASRLLSLLYAASAKDYLGANAKSKNKYPKVNYRDINPLGVIFQNRIFDTKGESPSVTYVDASVDEELLPNLQNSLNLWATHWWFYQKDYQRIKNLRRTAVILPYLPQNSSTTAQYQRRLFF